MSEWLEATFAQQRPRAIAALTRYFRDVDMAEDAFSDACVKALVRWSEQGVPRDPLAWLLTVARNTGLDKLRQTKRRRGILEQHEADFTTVEAVVPDPDELRDDVLRLLFICCHPALDRQDQIAIALKIVAGLTVEEIARGFLVKPKAMEQRITRAKKKIANNPVAFETPTPRERGQRLGDVSLMIYLMFNEGWSTSGGSQQMRLTLCEEAIRLARLVVALFPGMGEQVALLSLLLLQHARRGARSDADGNLVALEEQDRELWDSANIAEGLSLLQKAQRTNHHGAYLIQAAIAGIHARAPSAEATDWVGIEAHYASLYVLQPTPVVRLNHIAAQAKTRGPEFALQELQELAEDLDRYRWYHAMRGGLLQQTAEHDQALAAFEMALALGPTEPERAVLNEKITLCRKKLTGL